MVHISLTLPLYIGTVTVPTALFLLPWALLPDQGCRDGKRNLWWYTYVWDMGYNIIAGGVLVWLVADTWLFALVAANWKNWPNRITLYPLIWVSILITSVAVKQLYIHLGFYTLAGFWTWLCFKFVVVISCTVGFIVALVYATINIQGWSDKRFFLKHASFAFCLLVIYFLVYLFCQLYVSIFIVYSARISDSECTKSLFLFEILMTGVFNGVVMPAWKNLIKRVHRPLLRLSTAINFNEMQFAIECYITAFQVFFTRRLFSHVSSWPALVFVILRNSMHRCLILGFAYQPRGMLSVAILEVLDESRKFKKFFTRFISAVTAIDFALLQGLLTRKYDVDQSRLSVMMITNTKVLKLEESETAFLKSTDFVLCSPSVAAEASHVHVDSWLDLKATTCRYDDYWKAYEDVVEQPTTLMRTSTGSSFVTEERALEVCLSHQRRSDIIKVVFALLGIGDVSSGGPHSTFEYYKALARPVGADDASWNEDDPSWQYLCHRIVVVQKNIRIKTIAQYMSLVSSSVIGVGLLLLQPYFPCTSAAYGMPLAAPFHFKAMWYMCIGFDVLEVIVMSIIQWNSRLDEEDNVSWFMVKNSIFEVTSVLTVAFGVAHVITDTFKAQYKPSF